VKTKTAVIVIFIVVAIAGAALVMQNQAQSALRQENAALKAQADQGAALQAENDRLSNQLAQASSQLSPDQMRELVKLRGEVGVLRSKIAQLQGQSGELQRLRDENSQLRERPTAQAAPAPPPNAAPPVDPEAAKATCINYLRLLEGAKQQFASANGLHATDTVTPEQILPILQASGLKDFPKCPMGGTYNIGIIAAKAACSIPGHVLQ
jgi:TolA-binding protein